MDVDRQSICRLITVGQKLCESNRNTDDQAPGHPHTRLSGALAGSPGAQAVPTPAPLFLPAIRADPLSAFRPGRTERWASIDDRTPKG